jgi:hypothetical protein
MSFAPHQRRLDHEADRVHEHVCPVELCQDLIGAVGVGPQGDLRCLTSSHVHCHSVASDLVPSPEHLHENVGVLSPGNVPVLYAQ